jgi:hypothetical protein
LEAQTINVKKYFLRQLNYALVKLIQKNEKALKYVINHLCFQNCLVKANMHPILEKTDPIVDIFNNTYPTLAINSN